MNLILEATMQPIVILLSSILLLLMVVNYSEGRIYTRCQLAKLLYREYNIPRKALGNWVCLIEAESGRNTKKVSRVYDNNGSRDYGLFQINSRYWCSGDNGSTYNQCEVSCSAFTNDRIDDDVKCARKIYSRFGYNGWSEWRKVCIGKNVQSYVEGCKL